MSEERNQYAVVPFDTFERYLGPRYENIPGVEYILENGTLLYFMEEAPGVYESGDHTVTGAPAAPKLFVPVYEGDEMQPHAFAEAVDHRYPRHHLVLEAVATVGQHGGDAGVDVTLLQCHMAHLHPGHVGDEVPLSPGPLGMEFKAAVFRQSHSLLLLLQR